LVVLAVLPIVIAVVDVETPPVPMFIVFVWPEVRAPVAKLNVAVEVVPKTVPVVTAANSVTVVASAKSASVPVVPVMFVAFVNVTVVFLIVVVPVVEPNVSAVPAPNIVAVVAAPNTAREAGLAAEKTVAKPDEPLIVVALGNETVVLLIVAVPVEEPKLSAVAAPKIVAVVAAPNTARDAGFAAEKTVARPEDPLIIVALGNDTVVLLIVAVPVEEPTLIAVAAPKIVAVVADPNTAREAGFAAEKTVASPEDPLITVAFGNETVVLLIVAVPVEEPKLNDVAAAKIVAVVAAPKTAREAGLAEEKTVASPEDPLIVVALGNDTVVLLMVAVPVEDPKLSVVAEVALNVVALFAVKDELKTATVPLTAVVPMFDVAMLTVNVPVAAPTLTLEAPAPVPPVPTLTVFALAALLPVAKFNVEAAVVLDNVTDVDSPNIVIAAVVPVMDVALVNVIVAFLIVAVPVAAPSVRVVPEPKIVAVVAAPNTARDAGLAAEKTVAKPVEPLIVVAFGKSTVAFLIVPVPDVAPNVNDEAEPKAVAVVAAPNTAREAGLAAEKTVASPVEPLIVVALGKSIVVFLIVPVPDVAPSVNDDAEPKTVAVVAAPNTAREAGLAAEKTVAKPVEPLIVVAFGKSTVTFLIVPVPVVAPNVKDVAEPKAVTVVALPRNVIVPDAPVNVVAFGKATVVLLIVVVPELEPKARVVAAPPMLSVVTLAFNTFKEAVAEVMSPEIAKAEMFVVAKKDVPCTPIPPVTFNAPEVVPEAFVEFVIVTIPAESTVTKAAALEL
jgi:hypothetical protein